jgi:hypothetical protein
VNKPEEAEVNAIDRLMAALNFQTVRFSQPRHTMQTPGWVDRVYLAPKETLFWEAKRPKLAGRRLSGRSGAQLEMGEYLTMAFTPVEIGGVPSAYYCVGDRSVVLAWLERLGFVKPGTDAGVVLRRVQWPYPPTHFPR